MGHTVYYLLEIVDWDGFRELVERAAKALGFGLEWENGMLLLHPPCRPVEPLRLCKKCSGFVKTNLVEPCHSVYLLVLHSAASFGSVSLWED